MADDPNEDTWLYGSNPEPPEDEANKDTSIAENVVTQNDDGPVEESTNAVSVFDTLASHPHRSRFILFFHFKGNRKRRRRNGRARGR